MCKVKTLNSLPAPNLLSIILEAIFKYNSVCDIRLGEVLFAFGPATSMG